MKIAATIIGCCQVSPEDYQTTRKTYIFDSSQSIDEMLKATGEIQVTSLNLSDIDEGR